MDRRHALSLASLALLASCRRSVEETQAPNPPSPSSPLPVVPPPARQEPLEGADLTPVEVNPSLEIRTITGLRPFRPSGFVVRKEEADGKTLVHHYGHGGGGVTLSWGTAHQAVRLAGEVSGKPCLVVGGGIMGLSTARLLQRHGAKVTLLTRNLPPDTTSNVAGAQWWPFSVFEPSRRTDSFGAQFVEAAHLSFLEFQRLIGTRWGVRWLPNYYLSRQPHSNGWMTGPGGTLHDLQIGFRDFGPGEHVFPLPYVRRFFTMLVEPSIYLATLLNDIQTAGAEILIGEVTSRDALLRSPQPIIFNCTGLGAGQLTDDQELTPIKGQLSILLPQPAVQYNLIHGDYYMFPRTDGIVLGGTYGKGQTDLAVDTSARERILQAHQNFFTRFRESQLQKTRGASDQTGGHPR